MNTALATTTSTTLGTVLSDLADTARALANEATAENTRRAYASAWRGFTTWCQTEGLEALPAAPGTVALYVAHLVQSGRKASTISGVLAAVAAAHRTSGHTSPTADEAVRRVAQGTRRALGTRPAQKAPVRVEELRRLVATLDESTLGLRDRALLVLGFAGAFRRSELVALDVADVTETRDGLLVLVRRSKTDKASAGQEVAVPYGSTPGTCPVRTLRAWLEVANVKAGPIFRAVNRHGTVSSERLTDKTVARVVQRTATAAGLDASRYAGHSLRAGLLTSAAEAGKPLDVLMRQSRHRSHTVALGYVRRAEAFKDNAAGGIGL